VIRSPIQKLHVMFLLFTITFLMGMGVDLYVPSLPAIGNYFGVGSHAVQLTIGLYMLGYSVGQIFLGILSDRFGRKKILLISGLFYTFISFSCVFSSDISSLIIYRFLQGIGIAGLGVVVRAVMVDCFSGLELTKAMSCVSASWALGPIVGPVIGGYLQHYFNWRANFYFFGFYGLFVFIYALLALPETNLNKLSIRPVEIFINIKKLLWCPVFLFGAVLASLAYSALVIFNAIGPFLIQKVLQYSAVEYGHMALFLGVGYLIGNFLNRIVISYIEPTKVSLMAIILIVFVSIIMAFIAITIGVNLYAILIPVFIIFILCGFIIPSIASKCIGLFPGIAGTTSALFGTILGGGVFVITSVVATLKANTQLPLSLMYIGIFMVCLVLFLFCSKCEKRQAAD
jgi:MFS transporter, DHA1 family, multidrug resistance protein